LFIIIAKTNQVETVSPFRGLGYFEVFLFIKAKTKAEKNNSHKSKSPCKNDSYARAFFKKQLKI
jgi:hypothetical protein